MLPVAPSVAALDVVANRHQKTATATKKPLKKKSAFLDDIAGGEGGEDDDANEQDYDSDDARFIDDESPENGGDGHRHHPQYFSSLEHGWRY